MDSTGYITDSPTNAPSALSLLSGTLAFIVPYIPWLLLSLAVYTYRKRILSGHINFERPIDSDMCFDDVAGCDNAKEELKELLEFLRNPESFEKLGATIPKGCLMIGPPGTGKGLLARALAGEANVPLFQCSASEFVEVYVGTGASRVRQLWADARKRAPCIVFIDELDAVGKKRGTMQLGGNDERDQTINQLLSEMDGFDSNSGVIIIAATNRPDVLDPALLRPGRFDRKIVVEKPDYMGRVEILRVHTRDKPLHDDVDLHCISKTTAGFSGADLANLTNEAAIFACRRHSEYIQMCDFDKALEKIIVGLEKHNAVITEDQKHVLAIHESGHTIVALRVNEYDNLKKVTIIPRGVTGGMTWFEPDTERIDFGMFSRQYLENQICVCLGGRVAEEITLGQHRTTTGASNDLLKVYTIAQKMVIEFGFSTKLGPIGWKQVFLDEEGQGYSEQTSRQIDDEIKHIVQQCYNKTKSILKKHQSDLNKLSKELVEKETLTRADIRRIIAV